MPNDDDEVIIIVERSVATELDNLCAETGLTRDELAAKAISKYLKKRRKKAACNDG